MKKISAKIQTQFYCGFFTEFGDRIPTNMQNVLCVCRVTCSTTLELVN